MQTVFIDEIDDEYDGTDAGEAIEAAGRAGDRSDGMGSCQTATAPTGLVTLRRGALAPSGTVADLGDGFGVQVVAYRSNGIENGSPTGSPVDDSGAVVESCR